MSKVSSLLIMVFLVYSCQNNDVNKSFTIDQEAFRNIKLDLVDSLGEVSFNIPTRYDTSFFWIHSFDCGKSCDEQKYRFQPKSLRCYKEMGTIWEDLMDSVDRLTVIHKNYFPFRDGINYKDTTQHNILRQQLVTDYPNLILTFDTLAWVNDRYFSIFVMENDTPIYIKKIVAITTIKTNFIRFQYDSKSRIMDSAMKNFTKASMELIKTIKIKKGV